MSIKINDTILSEQPSGLNESPTQIYSDQTSISGNKERSQFPAKKRAEMKWNFATPATVSYFLALQDAATPVVYENTNSAFYGGSNRFTGVLTVTPSEYQRGGSGMSALTVVIEEGQTYTGGI